MLDTLCVLVAEQGPTAVPALYKCPLKMQLMEHPVILVESGMVYERRAIQDWLESGKNTCPCSKIELPSTDGKVSATLQ